MDALCGLHQLDAQAGLLASGGLRVCQDERRLCGMCEAGMDRMRVDCDGSTNVEGQYSWIQGQRSRALREVPTRRARVVGRLLSATDWIGIPLFALDRCRRGDGLRHHTSALPRTCRQGKRRIHRSGGAAAERAALDLRATPSTDMCASWANACALQMVWSCPRTLDRRRGE